jgi:hypothetical protein|nr:hypothetical protein [Bacillus infantis]
MKWKGAASMDFLLVLTFLLNLTAGFISFFVLYKSRKLFNDRYAMTVAMSSSSVLSIFLSMTGSLFFSDNVLITIVSMLLGGAIGILFGMMGRLHAVLSGFMGGTAGGMAGAMMGAVIKDPALCNLPSAGNGIAFSMVVFSSFGSFIVILSMFLICYSLRV